MRSLGLQGVIRACGAMVPVFWLVACGGESSDEGCPVPVAACDITSSTCQSAIFRATACERGQQKATMPPVRVITADQFTAEMNATLTGDPSATLWTPAFQALGLLPAGTTLVGAISASAASNVVAYYDPATKRVSVIDQGGSTDPTESLFELSHEFTHALQDQERDITAYESKHTTSTDSHVAVTSLLEGEADVIGLSVTGRSVGKTPDQLDWSGANTSMWSSILQTIQTAPSPFVMAVQSLPYPLGTQYIAPRWLQNGQPAIAAIYDAPLLSALDWQQEIDPGAPTLVEPLDCYPTTAPAGYPGADSDQLGMSGVLGSLVASGQGGWTDTFDWRGDAVVVFKATTGQEAVAWRTRWDTAADASNFARTLDVSVAAWPHQVTVANREVALLVTMDPAPLAAWASSMACGTVKDLPSATAGTSAPSALWRGLTRGRHVHFGPLHHWIK